MSNFLAWPLKYRPKKIDELALDEVKANLQKLTERKNFPQAFLLAGPKGTGKTSTSRIISILVNPGLDKGEQEKIFAGNSFVVEEMDAASNRGIDDIRALKEKISLPPKVGEKSVYILDEAHMLTREAFNALLKVLEEPPAHVVFILATTELHKIPDTIVSRCNLVRFRKAQTEELTAVLARILDQEKKEYQPEALRQISLRAGGSFRDAVKLLEHVAQEVKKVDLKSVEQMGDLGLDDKLWSLIKQVIAKDEQEVVRIIGELRNSGEETDFVYRRLLTLLHDDLLVALTGASEKPRYASQVSLFLLGQLQEVPKQESGLIPFLALEIKLLELIFKSQNKGQKSPVKKNPSGGGSQENLQKKQPKKKEAPLSSPPKQIAVEVADVNQDEEDLLSSAASESSSILSGLHSDNLVDPDQTNYTSLCDVWESFVQALESKNFTLAAMLKSSKVLPDSNGITKVGLFYDFHKTQLEQQRFLQILTECGQEVSGGKPRFEFVVLEKEVEAKSEDAVPAGKEFEESVTSALI